MSRPSRHTNSQEAKGLLFPGGKTAEADPGPEAGPGRTAPWSWEGVQGEGPLMPHCAGIQMWLPWPQPQGQACRASRSPLRVRPPVSRARLPSAQQTRCRETSNAQPACLCKRQLQEEVGQTLGGCPACHRGAWGPPGYWVL